MTDAELEVEYDNRGRVPEHPAIIARWNREAAAFRASMPGELGLSYGPRERMRYDLFKPEGFGPSTPLAMYIHGGYWRAFDGSTYSHMAGGLVGNGIAVAIATYDLCPNVGLGDITEELRVLVKHLYATHGRPITVIGHSAGGHLAAMMLGTGWSARGLPANAVPAAFPISGLFELEPLCRISTNADLRLDPHGARTESPVLLPAPVGKSLLVSVGGIESNEFIRNSRDIVRVWGDAGVKTRLRIEDGKNHFDVLDPLPDPKSEMTADLVALVRGAA